MCIFNFCYIFYYIARNTRLKKVLSTCISVSNIIGFVFKYSRKYARKNVYKDTRRGRGKTDEKN